MASSLQWRLPRARWALWDFLTWPAALLLAVGIVYGFDLPPEVRWSWIAANAVVMGALQVAIGSAARIYQGRYRYGTYDEGRVLAVIAIAIGVASWLLDLVLEPPNIPIATLTATCLALLGMLGRRAVWRGWDQHRRLARPGRATLVYGAGRMGSEMVQAMLADPKGTYRPVAFLEDGDGRKRRAVSGVEVRGRLADLEAVATATHATVLVVAQPGLDAAALLDLNRRCKSLGVQLRVMPGVSEIVGGAVKLGDISEVTEEDLLGRRPIATDESEIKAMLHGKRILITGAGGSIGSEVARQVHLYEPAFVGMLDRDESELFAVQLSIEGRAMLDSDSLILADIRDTERVREVMAQVRPDVVIHAAALKHVTFLQRFPDEAFKTNVLGTRNVLQAARDQGVPVIVNISTDKAADPENALGYSKRTAERLTAGIAPPPGGRYLSVRFGNVLGSRGSVLPAFREQIARGGPVTVTDPGVTRYFMTIPEAVHLVLQAATIGEEGETLVLDMGRPVRIDDVARFMIEKSGRDIDVVYTGLRPGEKLHEVLASSSEHTQQSRHPLITYVTVPPLDPAGVPEHVSHLDALDELKRLALDLKTADPVPEPVDPVPEPVDPAPEPVEGPATPRAGLVPVTSPLPLGTRGADVDLPPPRRPSRGEGSGRRRPIPVADDRNPPDATDPDGR